MWLAAERCNKNMFSYWHLHICRSPTPEWTPFNAFHFCDTTDELKSFLPSITKFNGYLSRVPHALVGIELGGR
jgi:hypothetical protein